MKIYAAVRRWVDKTILGTAPGGTVLLPVPIILLIAAGLDRFPVSWPIAIALSAAWVAFTSWRMYFLFVGKKVNPSRPSEVRKHLNG